MTALKPSELTVKAARELMRAAAQRGEDAAADPGKYDQYAEQIFEDISLYEIASICDCELADLDDLTESELRALADACVQKNRHFFSMRKREQARTQKLLDSNPDLLKTMMNRNRPKLGGSSENSN